MHKELYVSRENLRDKARGWIASSYALENRHKIEIPEGKQALLVVDMQRFFLEQDSRAFVPAGAEIIDALNKLVKSARKKSVAIFASKHGHLAGDNFPFDHIWRSLLLKDDPKAEIALDQLKKGDVEIIEKSTYSAFQDTELDGLLKAQNIKVLVIAGVTSHLCVEATARHAFSLGYFPVIVADCCAAWNERQQLRTLAATIAGFGAISLSEDLFKDLP